MAATGLFFPVPGPLQGKQPFGQAAALRIPNLGGPGRRLCPHFVMRSRESRSERVTGIKRPEQDSQSTFLTLLHRHYHLLWLESFDWGICCAEW